MEYFQVQIVNLHSERRYKCVVSDKVNEKQCRLCKSSACRRSSICRAPLAGRMHWVQPCCRVSQWSGSGRIPLRSKVGWSLNERVVCSELEASHPHSCWMCTCSGTFKGSVCCRSPERLGPFVESVWLQVWGLSVPDRDALKWSLVCQHSHSWCSLEPKLLV